MESRCHRRTLAPLAPAATARRTEPVETAGAPTGGGPGPPSMGDAPDPRRARGPVLHLGAPRARPQQRRTRRQGATAVEIRRLRVARNAVIPADGIVPMFVFWVIPQVFLVSAGEAFTYIGQLDGCLRELGRRRALERRCPRVTVCLVGPAA
jgi:hypothetical protein